MSWRLREAQIGVQVTDDLKSEELRALRDRVRGINATPEYKANAAKLVAERAEMEAHYGAKAREERLTACGIQREHWAHVDDPELAGAVVAARNFMVQPLEPKGAILVLAGVGGAGKSLAASHAVWKYGGLVVQSRELVRASNFDSDFWDRMEAVKVLAIDDLGTEVQDEKGYFDAKFSGLIDGRLRRKTLITTNLPGAAFMKRYASGALQRLERRFREFGTFSPVNAREVGEEG